MKKKGFTLTEIIITITIIGILSLLGLNYVKRNIPRYDPLYYYRAYDALEKGFADAVANEVPLTSQDFCSHLLTIWNVDLTRSSCNLEVAMIKPSGSDFFNSLKFNASKYIARKEFILRKYSEKLFDKLALPVYASFLHGEEPPQNDNCTPCPCWDPNEHNGQMNPPVQEVDYYAHCMNPEGCTFYDWLDQHYVFPCAPPDPPDHDCGSGYFWSTVLDHCVIICPPPLVAIGYYSCSIPDNGYECTCDSYRNVINSNSQQIINEFINHCGNLEWWEDDCYVDPCATDVTLCPPPDIIGTIYTQNGMKFDFYMDTTFALPAQEGEEATNLTYFSIKATMPNSTNLEPIYFIVYPANKELFPVSPQLVENKNILPTYLISDKNNNKNSPVTKHITYKSARCEKETKIPLSSNRITPDSHKAYTNFVYTYGLSNIYFSDYCSGAETINAMNWINQAAKNYPRKSLELRTASPNGMR